MMIRHKILTDMMGSVELVNWAVSNKSMIRQELVLECITKTKKIIIIFAKATLAYLRKKRRKKMMILI